LRASVEYSNPQLTVEEVQGIITARLLEVCGNYFHQYGMRPPDAKDIDQIGEALKNPPQGPIVSFLLNTDDIEPDRYSMNPLKESLVTSGQSAFPCGVVRCERLEIDLSGWKKLSPFKVYSSGEIINFAFCPQVFTKSNPTSRC
jgi:hypothetical protein